MNAIALVTCFSMILVTSPALCMRGDTALAGSVSTDKQKICHFSFDEPKKPTKKCSKRPCGLLACLGVGTAAIACRSGLLTTEPKQPVVIGDSIYLDPRFHPPFLEYARTKEFKTLLNYHDGELFIHEINATVAANTDFTTYIDLLTAHAKKMSAGRFRYDVNAVCDIKLCPSTKTEPIPPHQIWRFITDLNAGGLVSKIRSVWRKSTDLNYYSSCDCSCRWMHCERSIEKDFFTDEEVVEIEKELAAQLHIDDGLGKTDAARLYELDARVAGFATNTGTVTFQDNARDDLEGK